MEGACRVSNPEEASPRLGLRPGKQTWCQQGVPPAWEDRTGDAWQEWRGQDQDERGESGEDERRLAGQDIRT